MTSENATIIKEAAYKAAKASTCIRRKVGAVLVKDDKVILSGHNGASIGSECCTPESCIRHVENIPSGQQLDKCVAVHAEMCILTYCAKYGFATNGLTMYVTNKPCSNCIKHLKNAGITTVYYYEDYEDEMADFMAERCSVQMKLL